VSALFFDTVTSFPAINWNCHYDGTSSSTIEKILLSLIFFSIKKFD